MATFTIAPIDEVAPRGRERKLSARALMQARYRDALLDALQAPGSALVVQLEPDEKPLTIRNRIKRAAEQLGRDDLTIRRRGNRIVAYAPTESES